jgi:hypothetical protein
LERELDDLEKDLHDLINRKSIKSNDLDLRIKIDFLRHKIADLKKQLLFFQ